MQGMALEAESIGFLHPGGPEDADAAFIRRSIDDIAARSESAERSDVPRPRGPGSDDASFEAARPGVPRLAIDDSEDVTESGSCLILPVLSRSSCYSNSSPSSRSEEARNS